MNSIHNLCKKIARLTDADFAAVERIAKDQVSYMHPLKMATAGRIQSTGKKNMVVIEKLRELRTVLNS
jgi:hypothetical protein